MVASATSSRSSGAGDRPRFRQDLIAELVEDGNKRFIDVADPDSGHVFRFYEVEYSLACAMDGERDAAQIVRWAQEELGLTSNVNEVRSVMSTLGELGYLESAESAAARPAEVERAPAAAKSKPADDQQLQRGIVHGGRAAAPAADDVELGHVGSAHASPSDLPKAPDLELGAPGTAKAPMATPASTQDIPLGASGRAADVSLDLSEGLAVGRDDVKEAVRQSQVMKAVDVPKELLEPVATPEPARPAPRPEPAAAPKAVAQPEPSRPTAKPVPQPAPEPVAAKPAAAKPQPAPQPHAQPEPPPPEPKRTSPALLIVLVLVVLGAAAFVVWKFILNKSNEAESVGQAPPAHVVEPPKPAEPPPPPVESEKLATEQPAAQELKAPTAGQIDTIAANDAQVKAGDVVVALVGHKPIETEMAGIAHDADKRIQGELDQAQRDRDAAEKAGNKAGVTAAEKRIDDRKKSLADKHDKLAAKAAELSKYVVKAPADGKIAAVAKAGARVTPSDVVAKLTPASMLVATFKTTSQPAAAGASVFLAIKGGEQKLACKVVDTANGTKIACPHDAATEGAEVTFAGVDTSAPVKDAKDIEMGEEGSAAAGSAAAPAPAPPPAPPHPVRPAHVVPAHPAPADNGSAAAPPPPPADQPAGSAAP